MLIDQLAEDIRQQKITPDEALQHMRDNLVQVWPEVGEPQTWGEAEEKGANASGLYHALAAVGASDRADEFGAEVVRLRQDGQIIQ